MKEVLEWLNTHWPTLAAALGIGSGSGILGKKYIDREQSSKIKQLREQVENQETRLKSTEDTVLELGHRLETNTLMDKQLRKDLEDRDARIQHQLTEMKSGQDMILSHLLSLKSK